jgi:hypothetical protein
MVVGTRAQVFHKNADKTTGGLEKKDLMKNKHGRIVSVRKHKSAKKDNRLEKAGYYTKKGVFGYVKKEKSKTRKHKSRKNKSGKNKK